MTNAELIDALSKLPPDAPVFVLSGTDSLSEIYQDPVREVNLTDLVETRDEGWQYAHSEIDTVNALKVKGIVLSS